MDVLIVTRGKMQRKSGQEVIAEFTHWLMGEDRSPKTARLYAIALERFFVWWEQSHETEDSVCEISGITKYDVKNYKDWLWTEAKSRANTVNAYLAGLRSFFNWLVDEVEAIPANPAARIKGAGVVKLPPKALSRDQQATVLAAVEAETAKSTVAHKEATHPARVWSLRDEAIVKLFLGTGIRLSELAALQMDDVQIRSSKKAEPHVLVRRGKGGKERVVELEAEAIDALRRWLEVRPKREGCKALFVGQKKTRGGLSPRAISNVVCQAGKRVNLHLTPHMLRHTFATDLLDQGNDLVTIQTLLGHQNINTTTVYTQPTAQKRLRAVQSRSWSE